MGDSQLWFLVVWEEQEERSKSYEARDDPLSSTSYYHVIIRTRGRSLSAEFGEYNYILECDKCYKCVTNWFLRP
jgi:hypothetical protein